MPPNTGVPTLLARQFRGAVGDDQRIEAENEGERGHHHRAEAQARALGRRLQQRHAALALLLGEFDDENAVLGRKADQHDHADLPVEIERQPFEQDEQEGAEHADRDREQDRHRDGPALVKADEEQIGEQDGEGEDDRRLAFGALLLEGGVGPFAGIAVAAGSSPPPPPSPPAPGRTKRPPPGRPAPSPRRGCCSGSGPAVRPRPSLPRGCAAGSSCRRWRRTLIR